MRACWCRGLVRWGLPYYHHSTHSLAHPASHLTYSQVVENQEAVELVAAAGSAEAGAQRLLEAAQQEWALRTGSLHCDDITVAVVLL